MPSILRTVVLVASTLLQFAQDAHASSNATGYREKRVGKVPAMGYDTFNAFAGDYTAELCLEQAKVMKSSGLVAAGYTQFILDDFYAEKKRNTTGYIVANATMFPDGVPAFSKQMKAQGVKLAAYGDRGYTTCGGYPGSFGHELQDLETWHSWGMSYLKLDNCST